MQKFDYTIKDEIGIHARPAGLLVKTAAKFASEITLTNNKNKKSADAKKLFSVMGLGVKSGDTVTVCAEGEDENEAAKGMKEFFETNL